MSIRSKMSAKLNLREYIEKVKWQKAKDGTHEYTVITWKPELEKEFREFVSAIYEKGFKEKFHGTEYTYYEIDGFIYWSMNFPEKETILINRKKYDR